MVAAPSGYLHTTNPVFSPGMTSKAFPSAASPQLHWWMWVSVWGAQSGSTGNLCRSLSFIFSKWLLRNPLSIWSFPSILFDPPAGEGGSQGGGSFPLIQLPLRGKCPVLISFSLSLFILFCPPQLCGDSSCPFRKFRLLAAFSRYFVRSAPHVDIFWYICGRRWVPHPSTPLFW